MGNELISRSGFSSEVIAEGESIFPQWIGESSDDRDRHEFSTRIESHEVVVVRFTDALPGDPAVYNHAAREDGGVPSESLL